VVDSCDVDRLGMMLITVWLIAIDLDWWSLRFTQTNYSLFAQICSHVHLFLFFNPNRYSKAGTDGDVGRGGAKRRDFTRVRQQTGLARSAQLPTRTCSLPLLWQPWDLILTLLLHHFYSCTTTMYILTYLQVSDALGLPEIKSRQWSIQETSALKGSGLFEGFDWLVTCIKGGEWGKGAWENER